MTYLKNNIILLLLPLLFFVTACEDEDKVGSSLKIVKTEILGTPKIVEGQIELSSPDFDFIVTQDWCEVTKEGSVLNIFADTNYEPLNRTAEIIITSGDVQYRVPVTQTGILFEFIGETYDILNFSLTGGPRYFRILTNVDYEVIIPEEDKDWLTVNSDESGTQTVTVAKSDENRKSKITFQYLRKKLEITINQYDYSSYYDLAGSTATMFYTNSKGERVETQIQFKESISYKELKIVGTFESGIEREIPIQYIDEKEGELRFFPAFLNMNFEDPAMSSSIKALGSLIMATQRHMYMETPKVDEFYAAPAKASDCYYVGPFDYDYEKKVSFYQFKHTPEGMPDGYILDKLYYERRTKGLAIRGINARGTLAYGTPYDVLYDIRIER